MSTDITAVRKRLLRQSTDMYERSVPYIESALSESGVAIPSHGRAVRDAAEGLIAGNVFLFTLAAVLRVADEADPLLGSRLARMAGEALNSGLDWLEGANDDLDGEPDPSEQIPGQQEIPAPRGFKLGDLVEITNRDGQSGISTAPGLRLNGKTGVVAEIDDNPEYPIGLTVDGWVGLVWCNSSELRHLDAAESAVAR